MFGLFFGVDCVFDEFGDSDPLDVAPEDLPAQHLILMGEFWVDEVLPGLSEVPGDLPSVEALHLDPTPILISPQFLRDIFVQDLGIDLVGAGVDLPELGGGGFGLETHGDVGVLTAKPAHLCLFKL